MWPSSTEQVRERVILAEDLRLAIERDEFELFYQPQLELASGRIVGLEALDPLEPPNARLASAIDLYSDRGIGREHFPHRTMGHRTACRQTKLWRDQGIAPPVVAVNISAAQFKLAGGLDQVIAEAVAKYAIAANQLELELTESVLMETTQRNSAIFEQLRRIGIRLAIDDFGTGYSSLDYLRAFHVARLKIDRRFIKDVTTNPDDAIIVRATISLAHELGIEVVAEGVETAEQQAFLISVGCKVAQGFFLGKPISADRTSALLGRSLRSGSN